MNEMDIKLTVNGEPVRVKAEPTSTLLSVLRTRLGLTGTKDGCSSGDCGACVVLLDERPVNACMVLAPQAEGAEVVTIEGLAKDGELHPFATRFRRDLGFSNADFARRACSFPVMPCFVPMTTLRARKY